MRKSILTIFIILSIHTVSGQGKKDLTISLGTGVFNSPYYTNAYKREFYNLDFDYQSGGRHIISANFLKGSHRYYDSINSNNAVPLSTPGYETNANSEADYFTFSVLYKYKLINNKRISVNIGAGAGIMTQVILFPYTQGSSVDFKQSSWTDLVFPVRLESDYQFARQFKVGILAGLYIHPDYPVLGQHLGVRVGYIFK
jgi:hypothetical protein